MKLKFYLKNNGTPIKKLFAHTLLPVLTGLMYLTGCTTYQYLAVDGDLPHNIHRQYVSENDSVKIIYTFAGLHGPVTIDFYNKLDIPLYVDWSRSALVLDSQRISYWRDEGRLLATGYGNEVHWNPYINSTRMALSGTIFHDEKKSFIPPQSNITVSTVILSKDLVNISPLDSFKWVKLRTVSGFVNAKRYNYSSVNSPISFRSFLAYSPDEDFSNPVYTDHYSWVSDIIRSTTPPGQLPYQPANQFYESKVTPFGQTLGIVSLIAILIALSAVAAAAQ